MFQPKQEDWHKQPYIAPHEKITVEEIENIFFGNLKKYKKLKETKKHVIDIGDALMKDTTLSYIDGVHYTPRSNRKIAEKISLFFY